MEKERNPYFLQPFLGIPTHNNKALQILYPLFSFFLISCTLKSLLEKGKIEKYLEHVCTYINSVIAKLSQSCLVTLNAMLMTSPFILSGLFVVSLLGTVCNSKNFDNKWNNTSAYSKANDALYWLGAGAALSSLAMPFYALLADIKLPNCKIFGEVFAADQLTLCVASTLLACALLMSLMSTLVPSLTEPKSYIEGAQVTTRTSKINSEK